MPPPRRVVIDPNVVVSAATATVTDLMDAGIIIPVISPALVTELDAVLRRDKFRAWLSLDEATAYVEEVVRAGESWDDPPDPPQVSSDPDDGHLIALARSSESDAVVSGDADLTDLDLPDLPAVLTRRELLRATTGTAGETEELRNAAGAEGTHAHVAVGQGTCLALPAGFCDAWFVDATDAELAAHAAHGDAGSLAALVDRHRSRMYAVAVAMLGPGGDVADVVQDASLVALTRIGSLRDPGAVGSWLTGITRNLCRSRLRQQREVPSDDVITAMPAEAATDPQAVLDTHVLRDWVWDALDDLSEPLRHVVVLRYFSRANSYDAIAGLLGVPVGTVRSRLHSARKLLTGALAAAAVDHDHDAVLRQRVAQYAGIFEEYNRGLGCSQLGAAMTADVEFRVAGTAEILHGAVAIVRALETDIEAGVRLQPLDVVAGRGITVVEAAFRNPADAPDHCPAMTTQVYLQRGDAIAAIAAHYSSG